MKVLKLKNKTVKYIKNMLLTKISTSVVFVIKPVILAT